jgi:hypothetical protein
LAVVTAFFAALYWSAIETYTEPNALQLVGLEGKLNGYPEVWKHDSSLVSLGVRFKLAGDPEEKRLPVYAYKDAFEATGLRQGARVSLLVEYTPEQTIVREMHTLDGQVLFDDRMHQHVVAEGNNAAQRGLIFSLIVTALFVAGALEALWRQLRASSGSEADLQ